HLTLDRLSRLFRPRREGATRGADDRSAVGEPAERGPGGPIEAGRRPAGELRARGQREPPGVDPEFDVRFLERTAVEGHQVWIGAGRVADAAGHGHGPAARADRREAVERRL